MTTTLEIHSGRGAYPVRIGSGILQSLGDTLRQQGLTPDAGIAIITDEAVNEIGYPDIVQESLIKAGYDTHKMVFPPGDASKSLQTCEQLYEQMLRANIRRNGVVVAVGGGVVGDLGGFVAATYLRGVRFVQVPTTLLAHDSSIGGKVGVNLPAGKNLVGAFHPPICVHYDIETLRSLPVREWRGGMAEVIKHGIIGDEELFAHLEHHPARQFNDVDDVETWLSRACAVKVAVVEEDERESALRMVLNLGHTVGHAVEQVSRYNLNHGEAIAIGMVVESEIAVAKGLLKRDVQRRIRHVLEAHGLPVRPPNYDLSQIFEVLAVDKKHGSHGWTFALPTTIGHVIIEHGIKEQEVREAWELTLI